jgi:hypothetical protein
MSQNKIFLLLSCLSQVFFFFAITVTENQPAHASNNKVFLQARGWVPLNPGTLEQA